MIDQYGHFNFFPDSSQNYIQCLVDDNQYGFESNDTVCSQKSASACGVGCSTCQRLSSWSQPFQIAKGHFCLTLAKVYIFYIYLLSFLTNVFLWRKSIPWMTIQKNVPFLLINKIFTVFVKYWLSRNKCDLLLSYNIVDVQVILSDIFHKGIFRSTCLLLLLVWEIYDIIQIMFSLQTIFLHLTKPYNLYCRSDTMIHKSCTFLSKPETCSQSALIAYRRLNWQYPARSPNMHFEESPISQRHLDSSSLSDLWFDKHSKITSPSKCGQLDVNNELNWSAFVHGFDCYLGPTKSMLTTTKHLCVRWSIWNIHRIHHTWFFFHVQ